MYIKLLLTFNCMLLFTYIVTRLKNAIYVEDGQDP